MSATADPHTRILDLASARGWRDEQRGVVVFTNGVFDLLHPGHVDVLRGARAEGDHLIVGLNSDASVRRLGKGPDRPIRSQEERAYLLASLVMVDAVTIFDEDTPASLVAALRPDVIVKGGDYTPAEIAGADDVLARGGRVVIIPLTAGHSTTALLSQLRSASDD